MPENPFATANFLVPSGSITARSATTMWLRSNGRSPRPWGACVLVDVHRLVTPMSRSGILDQVRAVVPLAGDARRVPGAGAAGYPEEVEIIALGICGVLVGLMLFMEGVQTRPHAVCRKYRFRLPGKATPAVILCRRRRFSAWRPAFAEPAIWCSGSCRPSGVRQNRPGCSKALLGPLAWKAGSGGGRRRRGGRVVLGFLRYLFGWRMKPWSSHRSPRLSGVTVVAAAAGLDRVIGLAWDCNGITTGPATVPLVLAVGIGVAASARRGGDNPPVGIRHCHLASLLPVLGVFAVAIALAGQPLPPIETGASPGGIA